MPFVATHLTANSVCPTFKNNAAIVHVCAQSGQNLTSTSQDAPPFTTTVTTPASIPTLFINPQHASAGYSTWSVCVCVSVTQHLKCDYSCHKR